MLLSNVTERRSPALSVDLLSAIYLHSHHYPTQPLQHVHTLTQPIIFERTWVLYLSYYQQLGQHCEHIIASCLTDHKHPHALQMAVEFFLTVSSHPQFLEICSVYDLKGDFRLVNFVLLNLPTERKGDFVSGLILNVYNHGRPSVSDQQDSETPLSEDQENSLIRAFNHEKELSSTLFQELLGDHHYLKLTRFILRNEGGISREKLSGYLEKDEEACREFLRSIVERKRQAPIDELLR